MISTNTIRNTVLHLLNKANRGFISPSEYDSFSDLAQMSLFEESFYDYAKWIVNKTNRRANSGASDISKHYQELIDVFSSYSNDTNFTHDPTTNLWSYIGDNFYRTLNLSLVNAQGRKRDIEIVSKQSLNRLINSTTTAPSVTYPIAEKIGESFKIYPSVLRGYTTELLYIRTPNAPRWTYQTVQGNPVYDQSSVDLQDFELPSSMFEKLVVKIMAYCGVSIRESDVVQLAAGEQAAITQKES